MDTIDSFRGEYRFLSNFFLVPIEYQGYVYPSTEHAYQAMKVPEEFRNPFRGLGQSRLTPGMAKRLGTQIVMDENTTVELLESWTRDWNSKKLSIMCELLEIKFAPGTELREKLDATKGKLLVEGNHWGDTFWGVCNGKGENHLGILLMNIRDGA